MSKTSDGSRARRPLASSKGRLALVLLAVGVACGSVDSRKLTPAPVDSSDVGGTPAVGGSSGGTKAGRASTVGSGGTSTAGDDGQSAGTFGLAGTDGTPECGDGRRSGSEQCDDGNVNSGDGCDSACRIEPAKPRCGDASKAGAEECDDGNLQPGDGCDDQCREEVCGNGRIDAGEQCDPPSAGKCTIHCSTVLMNCGDGKLQANEGEECDDGNDQAGDGCFECRHECGDGRIDASIGEQCEPCKGDQCQPPEHCSASCQWLPVCGDGDVQTEIGEECDPSNGVTCIECHFPTACEDGAAGCTGGGGAPGDCVPDASSDLVQNGGFVSDTSGWTPQPTVISVDVADDGSPAPKALEVSFAAGPVRAEAGAYQCLPVRGGHRYELQAAYRIPSDAPDDVGAAVIGLLYAGSQCAGSYVSPTQPGPQGLVRGAWTPYSYQIDTSALPDDGSPARLLVRLDVVRPANVEGSRVLWDSVSLNEPGARCGDCTVDDGETCDDGNRTAGDGCNASCQIERCGDGARSVSEQCDDGNTTFGAGDQCTPACRVPTACDTCDATTCAGELDACFGLTGAANAGPREGAARSTLCDELLSCVRKTDCDLATRTTLGVTGAYPENCYCGTAGEHCFDGEVAPNGSCRAQIEAALETTSPSTILGRLGGGDADFPIFANLKDLLACEGSGCTTSCARSPSCGDGQLEDRNLDFTFIVDRQEVPCDDALTATGHGCSFEECDDGNLTTGDGCDEHCFVEACGNHVIQAGEDCDDGNRDSGDGCSATCKAESHCGNDVLEAPFEDCDPPRDGAVCTEAQSESTPDACACDTSCKFVVCGDGSIQRPYEDCDPPNGVSCGDDCKFLARGPCEDCIAASVDADFQATYCDVDAACVTVERCVIDSKCFNPLPQYCYCGTTDLSACQVATFTPVGACASEIKAGEGHPSNNAQALDLLFDSSNPTATSNAMNLLSNLFDYAPECHDLCF